MPREEGREGGREGGVLVVTTACIVHLSSMSCMRSPALPPSPPSLPTLDTVITPESLECQLLFNVLDVDPVSGEVRREGGREGGRSK